MLPERCEPHRALSQPAWAGPLTWLGVTGDWEKRHKDRKAGIGWVCTLDESRCPPPPPSAFIYTVSVGKWAEVQVEFSWVQSHRRQEQRSCGMLLLTADHPDCQHALFSLQGSLAEPCSPPSCQGLAFSAQRILTRPCSCQSFFSVCLVTGLPQALHRRTFESKHLHLGRGDHVFVVCTLVW
jgi:hypothetical protein